MFLFLKGHKKSILTPINILKQFVRSAYTRKKPVSKSENKSRDTMSLKILSNYIGSTVPYQHGH